MSWLRLAVNKAVQASGKANLSRAVRTYADTVVNQAGQAVVGGSKLFQDRNGARNFQSYKLAVKRLEEVSVSCRGIERVQLLRRWLVALKEIERLEAAKAEYLDNFGEYNPSLKPNLVMYYDPDIGGEPMSFRDVFLESQALEGITLSLILEEPSHEELSLLLEIYRLCLLGGKEAHDVTVSSVKDLARAFSTYNAEVLVKREELLQYVQDAIAGLKVHAAIVRIDSEVSYIHKKLNEVKNQFSLNEDSQKSSDAASGMSTEHLKEDLEHILLCSRLEELLLQKKLMKSGDTPESHQQKVDKLKILSESLAGSASKAEKRILDNRVQKEEALKFRIAKTDEVALLEKELTAEIKALEHKRDDLEEELRKVNTSLTSARARLRNAKEERDQFDDANNEIIQHFKLKEDELSKSISSYRAEAKVCNTFISFLQSTWAFQLSCIKQNEKLITDELKRYEEYLMNMAVNHLTAYKKDLGPSISSIREIVLSLKGFDESSTNPAEEQDDATDSERSDLEQQYQITSTNIITTFGIVENIKKQISTLEDTNSKKSDERIQELLEAIENMKVEFESIEKPSSLKIAAANNEEETVPSKPRTPKLSLLSPRQPSQKKLEFNIDSTSGNESQRGTPLGFSPFSLPLVRPRNKKSLGNENFENLEPIGIELGKMKSDAGAQLSKLKLELELENHIRGNSVEGNIDWEFDEIPRRVYDAR